MDIQEKPKKDGEHLWIKRHRNCLVGFEPADDALEFHPFGRVAAQGFFLRLPVRDLFQPAILDKGLDGALIVKKDGGFGFGCVRHGPSPL
jgi:hypothetical protein